MGSWQEPLAPYQHVTYWHTPYYSSETKTNICQEGRKQSTERQHGQRSGLATEVPKQIPDNTWFEENYAQNVSGWNNLTFPNTSVLLSETAK